MATPYDVVNDLHARCAPLDAHDATGWLENACKAVAMVQKTFPPEKQETALCTYIHSYCENQSAVINRIHAIALLAWAKDKRKEPYGPYLGAACTLGGWAHGSHVLPDRNRGVCQKL
jgi:hypothetical protein